MSNTVAVSITVKPHVIPPPEALEDNYIMGKNTVLNIDAPGVLINDIHPTDAIKAFLLTNVSHGTLIFNEDGSFHSLMNP